MPSLELSMTGHFVGWRRSEGWARDQIVYFAGEFSQPFTGWGISENDQVSMDKRNVRGGNLKAFFTFDATSGAPILIRVGISAVSFAGALRNLRAEINDWDFDRVKTDADRAWNNELNKIQVDGRQRRTAQGFLHGAVSLDDCTQPVQ